MGIISAVNVVNLKKNKYTLYIGRENKTYGLKQSKWANPYVISDTITRDQSCELYEEYVRKYLWNELDELEGEILGCWCVPKKCHGHVLIKLLNEKKLCSMFMPDEENSI